MSFDKQQKMNKLRNWVMCLALVVVLTSCSDADGNYTGSEYMPDMAHSVALEANTNNGYYYNTWDEESTIPLHDLVQPRGPVAGTIPRGYAGGTHMSDHDDLNTNTMVIPTNGFVPYHYADSPEGRQAALDGLLDNPFPITADGLATGKELYDIFCATCHGESGNGLGYLYNEDENPNAKYPLAPANFLRDEFYAASNGRYYHAIYYGYNAMGAYKDKLSYEERWQVIHYIRQLQATEQGLVYNEEENTYNGAFGTPGVDFYSGDAHHATDGEEHAMMAAEPVETHDTDDNSHETIINK